MRSGRRRPRSLRVVYRCLRAALHRWNGDGEYERYLQWCAERRLAPLDRGRYFAQRLEEKYTGVSRCC